MTSDIRKLIDAQPFVPFTIHMSNGRQFRVETLDHIKFFPSGNRVIVLHDEDDYDVLSALHMNHLTVDAPNAAAPTAG